METERKEPHLNLEKSWLTEGITLKLTLEKGNFFQTDKRR